ARRTAATRVRERAAPPGRRDLAHPPAARKAPALDALRLERRLRPLFQGLPPDSGVAVAVIQGDERAVACRGYTDPAAERPVRADTRFELGSITKTFTGLLLAEMVARGEVRYDDPIDAYLPAGSVPGYPKERPITLLHLATHTSGLPRHPVGLLPAALPQWFTRPCATFNATHLLRSLPRTPVRGTPGAQVRYSSLGCGLLGLLLENAAGSRYEDLLATRVCAPLGMVDTSCGPGGEAGGGYRRGRRVPSFRIAALPGAAALRSSADDMLRYLQALLAANGAVGSRLEPLRGMAQPAFQADPALRTALGEVRQPRAGRRLGGTRICLGWKQRQIEAAGAAAVAGSARRRARGVEALDVARDAPVVGFGALEGFEGLRPQGRGVDPGGAGGRRAPGRRGADGRLGARERAVAEQQTQSMVFHEGTTRGFVAFAGFDPAAGTGLVAMVSSPPSRRRGFLQTAYETLRGLATEEPDG
ncbi:serine hydrolase domain-containing protein, partial [Kitasatospora nipponensis]|uniref:serine hydrolase domain-containing protein n=1 Tax=Kitasatospora nipponensis TaxID=258049 RepID=UPI0031CE2D66